jgi:alkenylglycerophosphocholine hydrolase
MTAASTWLLVATLVVAAADWWAVDTDHKRAEYVLKPLTMVLLIATALVLEPTSGAARLFLVAGLVFSLAGDVFLMLDDKFFIGGLSSFLVGHVMYVVALLQFDIEPPALLVGVVIVLVASAVVGSRVVRGSSDTDPRLPVPVATYLAVISLMVVTAIGTTTAAAIVGALLFFASDGLLGWNRFVAPIPRARLLVNSAYHLGQVGLVLALVG